METTVATHYESRLVPMTEAELTEAWWAVARVLRTLNDATHNEQATRSDKLATSSLQAAWEAIEYVREAYGS